MKSVVSSTKFMFHIVSLIYNVFIIHEINWYNEASSA